MGLARTRQTKQAEQPKARKPMSSAFNQSAAKPEAMDSSPSLNAEQKPDIK